MRLPLLFLKILIKSGKMGGQTRRSPQRVPCGTGKDFNKVCTHSFRF